MNKYKIQNNRRRFSGVHFGIQHVKVK